MSKQSKAYKAGFSEGQEFANEYPDEVEACLQPGLLGADEGLINALGVEETAKLFGVRAYGVNGFATDAFQAACGEYNKGFDAALKRALKRAVQS